MKTHSVENGILIAIIDKKKIHKIKWITNWLNFTLNFGIIYGKK